MTGLHPDYGLTDDVRVAALQDAERFGVQWAAETHRVSPASLYKWRKVPALVKQMMMTDDKELNARLRDFEKVTVGDAREAAARIEALTKERDEAVHLARMRKTFTEEARDERDAAAAKLAKAVEIGNKMAHSIEGNYYLPNIAGEWRKVAAEIKGESHE